MQPRDEIPETGDQGIVEALAEPDADPIGPRLSERALEGHTLVQVVPDSEVICCGLDRCLVHHAVALECMSHLVLLEM